MPSAQTKTIEGTSGSSQNLWSSSLSLKHCKAVLLMESLQASQAMSSETQHTCWRICRWRRWCSDCRAQEEVRRAAGPSAFERAMQYSPVFQSLVATRSCYTAQSLRSSRQVLLKGSMSHHAMEKDVLTMWCCRSRMLLVRSLRSPDSSAFGVSKCTFGPSNEEQIDRNGRKLRISLPGWAPSLGTSKNQALLRPGRCY